MYVLIKCGKCGFVCRRIRECSMLCTKRREREKKRKKKCLRSASESYKYSRLVGRV